MSARPVKKAAKKAPSSSAGAGGAPAAGLAICVVAARFNGDVVEPLLERCLATLERAGLPRERVRVYRAPGAFELPLLTLAVARSRRPDAIIALGAVIRGQTPHFDFVAGEAARGLQEAAISTGVPVSFGVITANDVTQAVARTRPPLDRGAEAAQAAIEMVHALRAARRRTR